MEKEGKKSVVSGQRNTKCGPKVHEKCSLTKTLWGQTGGFQGKGIPSVSCPAELARKPHIFLSRRIHDSGQGFSAVSSAALWSSLCKCSWLFRGDTGVPRASSQGQDSRIGKWGPLSVPANSRRWRLEVRCLGPCILPDPALPPAQRPEESMDGWRDCPEGSEPLNSHKEAP